jgi:hypothetical protein
MPAMMVPLGRIRRSWRTREQRGAVRATVGGHAQGLHLMRAGVGRLRPICRAMLAPAVTGDPDDLGLDAGVQIAAAPVLGEEGVQVGQQGHRREPTARCRACARGCLACRRGRPGPRRGCGARQSHETPPRDQDRTYPRSSCASPSNGVELVGPHWRALSPVPLLALVRSKGGLDRAHARASSVRLSDPAS